LDNLRLINTELKPKGFKPSIRQLISRNKSSRIVTESLGTPRIERLAETGLPTPAIEWV